MRTTTNKPIKPIKAESSMEEAFRTSLRALIDGDITAKSLGKIERLARSAKECLMVSGNSTDILLRSNPVYPIPATQDSDEDYGTMTTNSLATSSSAETFATRMVREVMSAISSLQFQKKDEEPSPEKLVACIAEAKKQRLDALAQSLEARLMVSLALAPVSPPPLPLSIVALPPLKKNGKKASP